MEDIFATLDKCDYGTMKKVSQYCEKYFEERKIKKLEEKYEKNKALVGRCFVRREQKFFKVVSIKSNNEYRVTCLVFKKDPEADFISKWDMNSSYHHPNAGRIDFYGVYTDDILIKDLLEGCTEIDEEEYNSQLHKYIDKLIDFNWEDV